MKVEIKHPVQKFYAIISDVNVNSITDSEFSQMRKVIESCGVTVIKDQRVDDEEQISL